MQAFFFSVKLIEYNFSAKIVVPFIPCTKYLPRTRILFFLLLACEELLISTPKIIQFLPNPLAKLNSPFL